MLLDFNNKNLFNEKTTDFSNIINSFVKTLSNYLENLINKDTTTYCVSSNVTENTNSVLVTTQDGSGVIKRYDLSELPEGITNGTILQKENGKFVINEVLTAEHLEQLANLKEINEARLKEYKTEGVNYLVSGLDDDYIVLINQETGLEFDTCDLSAEILNKLTVGTMLTCKNGEYVIKND